MCTISNIGDSYTQQPWIQPYTSTVQYSFPQVSKEEFDKLKEELERVKEALKLAKKIDKLLGQPDCEMEEKVAMIKKMAEWLEVDLEDIFNGPETDS